MGVRCVVFDVDDTLYLERDYVRSGFDAVGRWAAGALGIPDFGDEAWAAFEAGSRRDTFDRTLASKGHATDPAVIRAMVDVYREHTPRIALLPDAHACLERLAGRVALAAVTDGPLTSQRAKAEVLDLRRWLEPIVFTAELGDGFGKPNPRAFRKVEEARGATGRECAYVADNPAKDFAAPAALGWRTVRVVRRLGLHAAAASGPDVEREVEELGSLPELLEIAP